MMLSKNHFYRGSRVSFGGISLLGLLLLTGFLVMIAFLAKTPVAHAAATYEFCNTSDVLEEGDGYASKGTGHLNSQVQSLQQAIKDQYPNINIGTADGYFGSGTESAVRTLQSQTNIGVDGKVGNQTRGVLCSDDDDGNGDDLALCSSAEGSYTVAPTSTSAYLYNVTETGCPNLYVTPDQDGWARVVYLTSSGEYVWKDWEIIYAGQANEMGTGFKSGVSWWVQMWNGYSYSKTMSFSSASGSPAVASNCTVPWTIDTDLTCVPTNITGAQLDDAVRAVRSDSPLIGLGSDVVATGNQYGINPIYIMAHAAWESAWGTSHIAQLKNNLFGFGAYDDDPVNGAYTYDSFAHSVNDVMDFVDRNYLTPGGRYYHGETLRGMNVRYATDPNWGNGIAGVMNSLQNHLPDPTSRSTRSAVTKVGDQPAPLTVDDVPDSEVLPTAVSLNNLSTMHIHTSLQLGVSLLLIVMVLGMITWYARWQSRPSDPCCPM